MTVVQLLTAASEELEAATSYYENHRSGLGRQLVAEARKTRDRIVALPNAAPEIRSGIRRRTIHRFPYHIIYRATDDQILIVAVAHKRRRPDYWVRRV